MAESKKRPTSIFDPVFWYRLFNTWRTTKTKDYKRAKHIIRILKTFEREVTSRRVPKIETNNAPNKQVYVSLSDNPIIRSIERSTIIDLDRDGRIVGIELNGLRPPIAKNTMKQTVQEVNKAYEKSEIEKRNESQNK